MSALYIYDNSIQNSVLNDSSHLNLDEYIQSKPKQHFLQKSTNDFRLSTTLKQAQHFQEDKKMNLKTTSISNLNEFINEVSKFKDFKTENELSKLISNLQNLISFLNTYICKPQNNSLSNNLNLELIQIESDLKNITNNIENYQKDIKLSKEKIEFMKNKMDEKSKDISQLSLKKIELEIQTKNKSESLILKTTQLEISQKSFLKVQKNLDDSEANIINKKCEIDELMSKQIKLSLKIKEQNSKSNEIELEIIQVKRGITDLTEIQKVTENEINGKLEILQKLQKQVRLNDSQKNNLESRKNELNKICEEVSSKIDGSNLHIFNLRTDVTQRTAKYITLKSFNEQNKTETLHLTTMFENEKQICDFEKTKFEKMLKEIEIIKEQIGYNGICLEVLKVLNEFKLFFFENISKSKKDQLINFDKKNKLERDIVQLRIKIINETVKISEKEINNEAGDSLMETLENDLKNIEDLNSQPQNLSKLINLESFKSSFVNSIFFQISEINKLTSDTTPTSKTIKICEIINSNDEDNFFMAQFPISPNTNEPDFLFPCPLISSNSHFVNSSFGVDYSQNNQNEICMIDFTDADILKFSRKKTPDNESDTKRQLKFPNTPSRSGQNSSQTNLGDLANTWAIIIKELANVVQSLTKCSSIFANTVSFFVGKLQKDNLEIPNFRNLVVKFI